MNHEPHTHRCGYCDQDVPCAWAADGGCIFPSTSSVTCNPCAERRHVLTDIKLLEPYRFYHIGERAFLPDSPKFGRITFTRHQLPVQDARGRETTASVMLVTESCFLPLPTPICRHSPTGLEWGYGGSGPADCSANILALFVSLPEAWRLHQEFKLWTAGIDQERGGEMSVRSVRLWLEQTWRRERSDLALMRREAELLAMEQENRRVDAELERQAALP